MKILKKIEREIKRGRYNWWTKESFIKKIFKKYLEKLFLFALKKNLSLNDFICLSKYAYNVDSDYRVVFLRKANLFIKIKKLFLALSFKDAEEFCRRTSEYSLEPFLFLTEKASTINEIKEVFNRNINIRKCRSMTPYEREEKMEYIFKRWIKLDPTFKKNKNKTINKFKTAYKQDRISGSFTAYAG